MVTFYQDPNPVFTSTGDYLDYLDRTPLAPGWKTGRQPSSETKNNNFTASRDLPHAMQLARFGWPEGLDKMTKAMKLAHAHGETPRRIHDIGGDLPDVGRYLAGRPDCMTRRVIQQGHKRPIIELEMNVCYSGDVRTDTIINIGAAVCSFMDELENEGYQTSLTVYICHDHQGAKGTPGPRIEIKRPGELLTVADMVFFIAHPSMLRRLNFRFWEQLYSADELCSGYGSPVTVKPEKEGVISFPAVTSNLCATMDRALEHVRNIVREQRPDLLPEEDQQQAA